MNYIVKHGFSCDCKAIRTEVFINEQGFESEFDDIDAYAEHIVLYDGNTPIATGRTFCKKDSPNTYHLGRIAVIKAYRKKGIGGLLVKKLESVAKEKGALKFCLSAQLNAKEFYIKLGYVPFGEEYKEEYCPHVKMGKQL